MKLSAFSLISLLEGMRGRLRFNFVLPEGTTAVPTLVGAVRQGNTVWDMEADGSDSLIIPALPVGVYLAEVRADTSCVLYGHVEVLPSPLGSSEAAREYILTADLTADVLRVEVNLAVGTPGPTGPQGPQGEQGPRGATGPSAPVDPNELDAWARGESTYSTPEGEDNANWYWCYLPATLLEPGNLHSLTLAGPTTEGGQYAGAVYLSVYQLVEEGVDLWEHVGVSTDKHVIALNSEITWHFEGATLSGMPIRVCALDSLDSGVTWQHMGVLLRSRTSPTGAAAEGYIMTPSESHHVPTLMLALDIGGYRFATAADLATHMADTTAHITEEERTRWNNGTGTGEVVDSTVLTTHLLDTTAHITAEEREAWNNAGGGEELTEHINDTEAHVTETLRNHPSDTSCHLTTEERTALNNAVTADELNFAGISPTSMQIGEGATADEAHAVALGPSASAGWGGTAVGHEAEADGENLAAGWYAKATGNRTLALGACSTAAAEYSGAIGYAARNYDPGTLLMQASAVPAGYESQYSRTCLYLIAEGSLASTDFCDGEAGLGYAVYAPDGSLTRSGAIKLSALMPATVAGFTPTTAEATAAAAEDTTE